MMDDKNNFEGVVNQWWDSEWLDSTTLSANDKSGSVAPPRPLFFIYKECATISVIEVNSVNAGLNHIQNKGAKFLAVVLDPVAAEIFVNVFKEHYAL